MHTWLPDAYSESPTPVGALLSGTLVNCAMYGIIRFYSIATKSTGPEFTSNLLIIFGLDVPWYSGAIYNSPGRL